jgi:hypothetical protein
MATVCTPTASKAMVSDAPGIACPAWAPTPASGMRIGTSISPAPCALAMTNDHSASPTMPARIPTRTRWRVA